MRIPSGVTDQYIYFVAVDATDLKTRETGLSSFTVYRSRNGAAAAAMTTPTVNETDSTNMPGVYELLLDEDMTIGSGNDSEEMAFHITATGMAPVTRTIELYRPKITVGETLTASSGVGEANAVQISGDATSADNLELQYDTSGLTGDTFPATQAQLNGVANVGSAVSRTAASYVLTTGTQSSGTIANVEELDGVNHEHTAAAGEMDLYYEFSIGGGLPSSVTLTGYLNSSNDNLEVYGYDWVAAAWKRIGTLLGKNASTNEVDSYELFTDMVGSGSDEGTVRVRFTDGAFTLTSATLAIDQIFVSFSQGSTGYDNGAVWIDTNESNTNTVPDIDGTARNPVSTMGAVNTLLTSTNLRRVEVAPGSALVFPGSQINETFSGHEYTIDFNGQSCAGTYIHEANILASTVTGAGMILEQCILDANLTIPPLVMRLCYIGAVTITFGSAGNFFFNDCRSRAPGTAVPTFDMGGAIGATNVSIQDFYGGIAFNNIAAGDVVKMTGIFRDITLNGADGTVEIAGVYGTITDNRTGSPTLVLSGAIKGSDVASILVDTAEIGAAGAGLTALASQASVDTVDSNVDAILVDTGMTIPAQITALNDVSTAEILGATVTEGFSAAGGDATLAQMLHEIRQGLVEFAIAGTTLTVKRKNGTTTAMTFTLDDASNPTSRTRAT